ncbi:MAG: replication-associated recombination protein A [Eubacteriaceae bacterium]|nr:replication-associated recombination protein A [Eubacteriaceae bacterium]MBR0384763.1 replication-associated recombination protein A [Eubacteriaceae bacterium]
MQSSFFDLEYEKQAETAAPLASRMRPTTLDGFVGQGHIVGKGKLLSRLIAADKLTSAIFYGPPGTGKTTLARIVAHQTKAAFHVLNAVTAGKKDIEGVIAAARDNIGMYHKKTILFIDEIHRFNKAQQDALLPSVEKGDIILIGATTENPYFEINPALVSRSTIFEFRRLEAGDVAKILDNAITDKEKGYGEMNVVLTDEAKAHLCTVAAGDVRKALNALELAVLTGEKNERGEIVVDLDAATECIQTKALQYDKKGDNHYDTISAFIKSIRGSDPDAALFWMAKMLDAGEDPKFIARRMVIAASEDIGNANPMGLVVAVAAARAVEMIGLPEARINLAQAVTYLAASPKSNAAVIGIDEASQAVRHRSDGKVPAHLRDAHYSGSEALGRGVDYRYPHNYPGGYTPQQYLPDDLQGERFYRPTVNGSEKAIAERLSRLKNIK